MSILISFELYLDTDPEKQVVFALTKLPFFFLNKYFNTSTLIVRIFVLIFYLFSAVF